MIAERLRAVRKVFGKSQKAFAAELGLSLSGLQGYESGTFAPGCTVLESLCRIGVDANWLLLGEGRMWRPGCEPPGGASETTPLRDMKLRDLPAAKRRQKALTQATSVKDVAMQEQDEIWKRLDFGTVALLASQGRQELAWYVLTLLVSIYPQGLSVRQILRALQVRLPDKRTHLFTARDVAAHLVAMRMQGLVLEEVGQEGASYRVSSQYARLMVSNVGDRSQALEKAVETLVRYIRPAVEVRPEGGKPLGRIMNIQLNIPAGKGAVFIRQITDLVAQACVDAGKEDGPDALVVVIGAAPMSELA